MSYFIFLKDLDNVEGSLYRIAENQSDLDNLNIIKTDYKILEDSQANFDLVKYRNKSVFYNNNSLIFKDHQIIPTRIKIHLELYISQVLKSIKIFLENNPNHILYNRWNDYYNQLNSLNLDSISFPLNISLEQYLKNQNQTSLNTLQLP